MYYKKIKETAAWLQERIDSVNSEQFIAGNANKFERTVNNGTSPFKPELAIILGTGLGQLASKIDILLEIAYKDIPNFPVSTVEGHEGKLIFGQLGGKAVMAMQGRFHYYEGYSMKEVTFPVRVMYELGIRSLIVSNAAGGANASFQIGDLMVITDHINAFPEHPLRGENIPTGPRFPDMHEAYDHEYIALADAIAKEKDMRIVHGVYYGTQGPSYETPAEYRAYHTLSGDAVGMSTVPEVIVARHCGIRVFGLSIITNMGISDTPQMVYGEPVASTTHEEVQEAGRKAQEKVETLITELVERM